MLRGDYYQKGFQIGYSLWDLLKETIDKESKLAKDGNEEEYDQDF